MQNASDSRLIGNNIEEEVSQFDWKPQRIQTELGNFDSNARRTEHLS